MSHREGETCMDHYTSDELCLMLARLPIKRHLILSELTYEVTSDLDNSLSWSRVDDITRVGCLWNDGLTHPLLQREMQASRKRKRQEPQLHTDDPLDLSGTSATPRQRGAHSTSRATGRNTTGRNSRSSVVEGVQPRPAAVRRPRLAIMDGQQEDDRAEVDYLPAEDRCDIGDLEHDVLAPDDIEEMADAYKDHDLRMGVASEIPGVRARGDEGGSAAETVVLATDGETEFIDAANNLGLDDMVDPPHDGYPSVTTPGVSPVLNPIPPTVEPWDEIPIPPVSGYVYREGRHIMRIQRGKPTATSVTVNCYQHPRCSIVVPVRRVADNKMLVRWYFSMPPCPEGMSRADKAQMTIDHKEKGKSIENFA